MSAPLDGYLDAIRAASPGLPIGSARLNTDGMANAVVIVDETLVFRFPKSEGARALQRYETELLAAIGPRLPVPVPQVEAQTAQFTRYRKVPGEPLYRHLLLRAAPAEQERALAGLGAFLAALHAIPLAGLPAPPWQQQAGATTRRARALARLEQVRERVYPYLWRDQQAWVEDLHAPVLDGSLDLDGYAPCLIHADLASYHLLIDPGRWELSGVIDFGTAGPGDAAHDLGLLLNTYGETLVRRLGAWYPLTAPVLDRARFVAGALELEWALAGVADDNPSMFLVHLGRARDTMPIGMR